jgi:hypothetical protein
VFYVSMWFINITNQTAYRSRLLRASEGVDGDLENKEKEKGKGGLNFPQV